MGLNIAMVLEQLNLVIDLHEGQIDIHALSSTGRQVITCRLNLPTEEAIRVTQPSARSLEACGTSSAWQFVGSFCPPNRYFVLLIEWLGRRPRQIGPLWRSL